VLEQAFGSGNLATAEAYTAPPPSHRVAVEKLHGGGNHEAARAMQAPPRRRGYVFIDPPPRDEQTLREWLDLAVTFVNTLPAKSPRLRSRRAKAK
jgi:hypothetical protein